MISAVFAILFGVSLLPGRKPLCQRFAERISDGIMPEGAEAYCRRLTWVWFVLLAANAATAMADLEAPIDMIGNILGHASLNTTRRYIHRKTDDIANDMMKALE